MFISLLSIFFVTKTSLGSNVCSERLLSGIPDDQITIVRDNRVYHLGPNKNRLNSNAVSCALTVGEKPYVQTNQSEMHVDGKELRDIKSENEYMTVSGIITQGHFTLDWVKKYYVRYSEDGYNWSVLKEPDGSIKIFTGNSNGNNWVTNKFNAEITVQILRIYLIKCHGWCCLRFDVIGCQATDVVTTTAMTESANKLNSYTEDIQATSIRSVTATDVMTTTARTESVQELTMFTEEIKATPIRPATDLMTTTAMAKSVQELATFIKEIQATPVSPATDVMTTTVMTESVQELTTFPAEIQTTATRRAPFVKTTMKILHESTESKYMPTTKKELSTLTDVLPLASSTSSSQSMTSISPSNCVETLNEGNATTEPRCYMACSKNHTEQELVEMIDKLKQELRKDKKKTSLYIRSKTSASDERKSSAAIGGVGVVILCAVIIGVLLMDLLHLVKAVKHIKHIKVHNKVTPASKA